MSTIYSKSDWQRRMSSAGFRVRKVYSNAVKFGIAEKGANGRNRLEALERAAVAFETGDRAYGIAAKWVNLAQRCRAIARDLKSGLDLRAQMLRNNPSSPDLRDSQDLENVPAPAETNPTEEPCNQK